LGIPWAESFGQFFTQALALPGRFRYQQPWCKGKGIIVSIAQVLNASGIGPGGPPAEEAGKMVEAIKAFDGFEHLYSLFNPSDGTGMIILVWRDKACMEAAVALRAKNEAQITANHGIAFSPGPVYQVFAEL
jgi:hypothetical protein